MSQIINIWEMLKGQNLGAYLLLHICLAIIWIEMGLHIISMIIHLISVNHQMRAEVPDGLVIFLVIWSHSRVFTHHWTLINHNPVSDHTILSHKSLNKEILSESCINTENVLQLQLLSFRWGMIVFMWGAEIEGAKMAMDVFWYE